MRRTFDVVIVGAGPTGLAALFWAARRGLDAVAIDAGDGALAAIRAYPQRLTFVSPSSHFEIARLPLDCLEPTQVTREEVLHYYARVLGMVDGSVLAGLRCRALRADRSGIQVVVAAGDDGRLTELRARNVVFTAWHEPLPLPPELFDPRGRVPTRRSVGDAAALPPGPVAIVGGGLSAHEQAVALMLAGRQVEICTRGAPTPLFGSPPVARLMALTGSRLHEGAQGLRVTDGGIAWTSAREGERAVRCTSVVACLGSRVSLEALRLLGEAGVLGPEEAAALARVVGPDQRVRRGLAADFGAALRDAVAAWPDLGAQLFRGHRGVRVAGGALHVGAAHAGIRTSIETARMAVAAIAGEPPPAWAGGPLPAALLAWSRLPVPLVPDPETVADLRPIAIAAWTRTALPRHREDDLGEITPKGDAPEPLKYLIGSAFDAELVTELLRLSDGSRSVAEVGRQLGFWTDEDRPTFVRVVCGLMRRNALSWLPPRRMGPE